MFLIDKKKPLLALKNFEESLSIRKRIKDLYGLAYTYNNIGKLFLDESDSLGLTKKEGLNKAKKMGELGLQIAIDIEYAVGVKYGAKLLSEVYEEQGDNKEALQMYKTYIGIRDSITNEETQKATIRQQTQYEFEKEQIRKENEANEQARILAQELKRRNNMEYSLIFLGILALFGLVMMLGFIKVSPNIAEGLIFFAFLIFFEFLLVFTEPYLEQYTQGEPVYALLANSALALIIFPLHAVLEKLLKKRIVK